MTCPQNILNAVLHLVKSIKLFSKKWKYDKNMNVNIDIFNIYAVNIDIGMQLEEIKWQIVHKYH